ncbi:hypothetical protein [Chroococcidiopsis cubana]|uniref:hypothetical protein n=1 Tax=Chroococcidiopsis cubana TaxID=171392 RepID=UPI0013155272|nr:hypothetical protein [Chroococcidiopsis cubana]
MAQPFSLTAIVASLFNNCKLNTSSAIGGDRTQKILKLFYLSLDCLHAVSCQLLQLFDSNPQSAQ